MSIIDELYMAQIEQPHVEKDEELSNAFDKISQTLTKEQIKLLDNYDCLNNQAWQRETQRLYKEGVKDGILFMLEVLNR